MNNLKEWGFSSNWLSNSKGEYWVIGQTILSIAFILLPVFPVINLPIEFQWLGMISCGVIAVLLGLGGLLKLGKNLTPLPHPKDDSSLVTGGVYAWVRHPIYSSVIFLALSFAIWQMSLSHALGTLIFLLDLFKNKEIWQANRHPAFTGWILDILNP